MSTSMMAEESSITLIEIYLWMTDDVIGKEKKKKNPSDVL
jgi:hypothetical protein